MPCKKKGNVRINNSKKWQYYQSNGMCCFRKWLLEDNKIRAKTQF